MNFSEKLLLLLSRKPGTSDYESNFSEFSPDNALALLKRVYPDFIDIISNKTIVDFGCGHGWQSISLVKNGAKSVLGLDFNSDYLKIANGLAIKYGVTEKVSFANKLENRFIGKFDIIISQNSMEHFTDPFSVLNEMKSALKPKGIILITFGPPWYAPYGSHMHFFTKLPWVNILFSEDTVMKVRARFRTDGANKYKDVESGLNKMTIANFERLIHQCSLETAYLQFGCVKGLNFLSRLPILRELFINHVSCILVSPHNILQYKGSSSC